MNEPLEIYNKRMFELMDLLKANGTIKSRSEFFRIIGIVRQQGNEIKNGKGNFKSEHIHIACDTYGINTNWIFGFENNVFRAKRVENTSVKPS